MADTYRNWLQSLANGSGLPSQEANALLQVVGDDYNVNPDFLNDSYAYTGNDSGQLYVPSYEGGGNYGYGPEGISRLNDIYKQKYSLNQGGTGSVLGASTGDSTTPDYSGQLAGLDASESRLKSLLGLADVKLDQGLGQLQDSYTQETNTANTGRTRALEDYGYQREDATNKKNAALGKVDTNARTLNDSLRRILGLASGSGSSAFQFAAPNAVAREATRQRSGVMNDTATDFRNLDTAEGRAKIDFDSLIQSLLNQRNSREQELREGILGQKQGIDTKLGDIASQRSAYQGGGVGAQVAAAQPYVDTYDARQAEINALFDRFRPQVTSTPVNPQQVALSKYITDPAAIRANRSAGTQDSYSPYSYLLKKQREQTV